MSSPKKILEYTIEYTLLKCLIFDHFHQLYQVSLWLVETWFSTFFNESLYFNQSINLQNEFLRKTGLCGKKRVHLRPKNFGPNNFSRKIKSIANVFRQISTFQDVMRKFPILIMKFLILLTKQESFPEEEL